MTDVDERNTYSRLWFDTFLRDIDPRIVEREVAFVQRQLPGKSMRAVLDLCCGPGRHLAPLAAAGYAVTGLDQDEASIVEAKRSVAEFSDADVIRGDMRHLPIASGALDGVICMWQSFGHFDDAANLAVLAEVARVLRPGGRAIFDLYHRLYYERMRGDRVMDHNVMRIVEQRTVHRDRLRVTLRYEDVSANRRLIGTDEFDWRLYTPRELIAEGHRVVCSPSSPARDSTRRAWPRRTYRGCRWCSGSSKCRPRRVEPRATFAMETTIAQ